MPRELQEWLPRSEVLGYEEIERLVGIACSLGVEKLRVTGGEPLTRRDVVGLFDLLRGIKNLRQIGVSTNGTLLAAGTAEGGTMASALRTRGVDNVNISLDTLDREAYAHVTGRDYLPRVLEGIAAAKDAGFNSIKLNCVLMRGQSENQIVPLAEFAASHGLLLRFIELMPVSTGDVLTEENFLPIAGARRILEEEFGPLIPEPNFRTNGPAVYSQVPGLDARVGFIGAMTNLHFCESCNKLRLTCDGKLRPCLGSHMEFDILTPMRAGASNDDLREFFIDVVARKPREHDFRGAWQPGRKMVAIGG